MKTVKDLFERIHSMDEGSYNGFDVMLLSDPNDTDLTFRVYHEDGYCFNVERQQHCEPKEIEEYSDIFDLQPDGATYHFDDFGGVFDGFKTLTKEQAITLVF